MSISLDSLSACVVSRSGAWKILRETYPRAGGAVLHDGDGTADAEDVLEIQIRLACILLLDASVAYYHSSSGYLPLSLALFWSSSPR